MEIFTHDIETRCLKKVVEQLTEEIEHYVNNGRMRQEIMYSDEGIWVDTDEHDYSIQICFEWPKDSPVKLTATAFPLKVSDSGFLQEDATGEEIKIIGN